MANKACGSRTLPPAFERPRRRTPRGRGDAARSAGGRARRRACPASCGCAVPRVDRRRMPARAARNASTTAFVLFRLARAGRVDRAGRPARQLGGVPEHRSAALAASDGRSASLPAPPDVRIAAQRAEAGAGRVDEHAVERRGERQRLQQVRLHDARRSPRRWRRRSAAAARCADRARRRRRAGRARPSPRQAPWSCRPARRRYRARRGRGCSPASSVTSCDASSCTTNQPSSSPAPRSGWPSSTMRPSGANARGWTRDLVGREPRRRAPSASSRRRFARSVSGAGRVVELQPRLGGVEPEPVVPARRQPARMRQRDAEVVERRRAIGRIGGPRRQRQRVALPRDRRAAPRSRSRSRSACPRARPDSPHRRRPPTPGTRVRCSS